MIPIGCNCGNKKSNVQYQVTFGNGAAKQTYPTVAQAQAALRSAGNPAGSSFKAIPA